MTADHFDLTAHASVTAADLAAMDAHHLAALERVREEAASEAVARLAPRIPPADYARLSMQLTKTQDRADKAERELAETVTNRNILLATNKHLAGIVDNLRNTVDADLRYQRQLGADLEKAEQDRDYLLRVVARLEGHNDDHLARLRHLGE